MKILVSTEANYFMNTYYFNKTFEIKELTVKLIVSLY